LESIALTYQPPTDVPMITTWRGRNVDTLSREEAIAALKEAARLYSQTLEMECMARELWAAAITRRNHG
jgi:hypothetical protein